MTGWGCFTLAHAFIKSESMLIGFRMMIGVSVLHAPPEI